MSLEQRVHVDFGILLNIGFGVFKAGLHRHLAAAGFADIGSSFGYVFRLLEGAPLNLKTVARSLGITPQGTLKLINDMVQRGYVERHEDDGDGRVKQLVLTERALAAMAKARVYHYRFEQLGHATRGRRGPPWRASPWRILPPITAKKARRPCGPCNGVDSGVLPRLPGGAVSDDVGHLGLNPPT